MNKDRGTEAERDMKQVKPVLEKILAQYEIIDKLSNDELRAKSEALKEQLRQVEAPFESRIEEIRQALEGDSAVCTIFSRHD